MKDPRLLTPAEFAIITILWDSDIHLSVSEVRKELLKHKSVAYTTVMTLLDKMHRKGSLQRVRRGKAYLYSPAVERSEAVKFIQEYFEESYRISVTSRQLTPPKENTRGGNRAASTVVAPPSEGEMDVSLL